MTRQDDVAVLVCGAGAAGLTLAIDLARRGIGVRLIDKLEAPFPGSRGKGIQPRTQEVFEDLGLIDRLFAAGGPYPPQREYHGDGSTSDSVVIEASAPNPGEPFNQPLMVPQFVTEAILRERLAELGHEVEFGHRLAGFVEDGDGVQARIVTPAGEKQVWARYLIGADGGRSFVRGELDVAFPGKTLGARAIVADVELAGLPRDAWHRFSDGDMERQIAICPLAGTKLFQIQAPIPSDGEVDLSAAGLEAFAIDRTGRDDLSVAHVHWASAYVMNARLADRYRVGRIFLVGDAAHIHPPTGGQGLNTSVQDAYNLGWKLAATLRGAPDALLNTYEEERRPVAAGMLGLATGLLDQMKQGILRRGREVHQLDLGYPVSSLSLDTPDREEGLRPGDRAPDALLVGAAGQPRRLFDLIAGPDWTLLSTNSQHGAIAPRPGLRMFEIGPDAELRDLSGAWRGSYGVSAGDHVLIRPDGYIGAIVASDDVAALLGYLAKLVHPLT